MNALVDDLKAAIRNRVDRAPAAEILQIVSTLCGQEPSIAVEAGGVTYARYIKIDKRGRSMSAHESDWVAVHDSSTGLTWSRDNVSGGRMEWGKAKDAAAGVDLCGFTDWRLPTIRELLSIVDYEKHDPAIDKDLFPTCESAWYWSSTPYASSPAGYAWYVYFNSGYAFYSDLVNVGFVRAVRAGQLIGVWPSSRRAADGI